MLDHAGLIQQLPSPQMRIGAEWVTDSETVRFELVDPSTVRPVVEALHGRPGHGAPAAGSKRAAPLPFGGHKSSRVGCEGGYEGISEFLQTKTVYIPGAALSARTTEVTTLCALKSICRCASPTDSACCLRPGFSSSLTTGAPSGTTPLRPSRSERRWRRPSTSARPRPSG
jgi:hypothetical protein